MDIMNLLIKQILIMLLYMICGYVLFRGKIISKEGSSSLAGLLVWLVIPMVLVKSFCVEPTPERITGLGLSILAAVLALGLSILVSRLIFKSRPIDHFGAAFSNAGFVGIPLVTATLGGEYVFYIAFFVAMLNILQWVYGVAVIRKTRMHFDIKTLSHPLILFSILGLVLFFTSWGAKLPEVISGTISGIAAVNTPLAMLVLGMYLAQSDLKELWKDAYLYIVSGVRLILIPLLTLLVFWLLQRFIPGANANILAALLITVMAPVGSNVAVYSQLHGKDYVYASKLVVISTLLSLVTIPAMVLLTHSLLK